MAQRSEDEVVTRLVFRAVNEAGSVIREVQDGLATIHGMGIPISFTMEKETLTTVKRVLMQLKAAPLGEEGPVKIPITIDYKQAIEVAKQRLFEFANMNPIEWPVQMGITPAQEANFKARLAQLRGDLKPINITITGKALNGLLETLTLATESARELKDTVAGLSEKVAAVDSENTMVKLAEQTDKVSASAQKAAMSFSEMRAQAEKSYKASLEAAAARVVSNPQATIGGPAWQRDIKAATPGFQLTEGLDAIYAAARRDVSATSDFATTRTSAVMEERQVAYNEKLAEAIEAQRNLDEATGLSSGKQKQLAGALDKQMEALYGERNALIGLQRAEERVMARFNQLSATPLGPALPPGPSVQSFSEQQGAARTASQSAIESYAATMAPGASASEGEQSAAMQKAIDSRVNLARYDKSLSEAETAVNDAVRRTTPGLLDASSAGERTAGTFQKMAHYAWFIWNPMVMFPALFAKFAISTAVSFDESLHHVQAFTSVSSDQMAKLRTDIESLATTYGLSLGDMGQAAYQLMSADIPAATAETTLAVAAKAAAASHTPLADVIGAVTGVVKAFRLEGAQIPKMVNEMAAGVIYGRLEFADFAAGLGRVIPLAAQMGLGMRGISTAIAILTEKGSTPADAFVQLRNILTSLNAPVARQVTTLHALGLTASDVSIRQNGLGGALLNVHDALAKGIPTIAEFSARTGYSATQSANFLKQLESIDQATRKVFGNNQTGMRAFISLTANGMSDWNRMFAIMGNAPTVLDRAWKVQSDSMETHLSRAKAAIEVFAAEIGTRLGPEVKSFGDAVAALGGKNTEMTISVLKNAAEIGILLAVVAKAPAVFALATRAWEYLAYEMEFSMGPVGWAALAASIGVVAYNQIPAFHNAVDDAVSALATDFRGGLYTAQQAVKALDDGIVGITSNLQAMFAQLESLPRLSMNALSTLPGLSRQGGLGLPGETTPYGPHGAQSGPDVGAAFKQSFISLIPGAAAVGDVSSWLTDQANKHDEQMAQAKLEAALQAYEKGNTSRGEFGLSSHGGIMPFTAMGLPPMGGEGILGSDANSFPITKLDEQYAGSQFQVGQQKAANDLKLAQEAMAHSLLNGRIDLDAFDKESIRAAKDVATHARALEDAQRMTAAGTGQWADVLKIDQGRAQKTYDNARANLIEGIVHKDPLAPLVDATDRAKLGIDKWTNATTTADHMILANVEKNTKSWDTLTKAIDDFAKKGLGDLALAIYRGKGDPTGKLAEAATQGYVRQTKRDRADEEAKYRAALGAGDYKTVQDIAQTRLQRTVDNATGKLTYDEQHPGRGNLRQDRLDVTSANQSLAAFKKQLDAASLAGKTFEDRQKLASDAAATSLGKLASAELTGKGLKAAGEKAVEMAQRSELFTRAMDKATLYVEAHSRDPVEQLKGRQDTAQHAFDEALARETLDIQEHGRATKDHTRDLQNDARGLKGYTDAAAKAALLYGTPNDRATARRTQLQGDYDNAVAVGAQDLREHGKVTKEHQREIDRDREKLKSFSDSLDKAAASTKGFAGRESDAQAREAARVGKLASIIMGGPGNEKEATRLAIQGGKDAQWYAIAQAEAQKRVDDALAKVNPRLLTFAQNLDRANKAYADALDVVEKLILTGDYNKPVSGQGGPGGPTDPDATDANRPSHVLHTQGEAAMKKLVQSYESLYKVQQAEEEARRRAGVAEGQWADVLQIDINRIDTKWNNATAHVTDNLLNGKPLTPGDYADLNTAATGKAKELAATEKGDSISNDALARAYRNAGLLADAFDLLDKKITDDVDKSWKALVEHFMTGDGDLGQLIESYKKSKDAKDRETQATIDAANAVGDFTQAVNTRSGIAQTDYQNGLDHLTEIIHDHGTWTQADIDAIKRHKAEVDQWTASKFDATFLSGDAATRSSMLMQQYGHLQSDMDSKDAADARISQANLKLIADRSAIQVQALNDIAQDIQDQTAVISAQSNLQKAIGDGQVQAIGDRSSIVSAQQALQLAELQKLAAKTDTEKVKAAWDIQVARDGVVVARDSAAANARAAMWSQRIAQDNVRAAMNKMNWDRQVQAAQRAVQQLQLTLDADDLKTAKDQAQLLADTLVVATDIDSNLGGVQDWLSTFQGDLAAIHDDGIRSLADQSSYAQASQALSQTQAQASIVSASDAQQLAIDEAASNASSIEGQLQIANDKAKEAYDQGQESLAVEKATLAEIQAQDQTAALELMVSFLEDLVTDSKSAISARQNMAGASSNTQMNSFSGDAASTVSAYRR